MFPKRRMMVEPPGTAPGSDPLITSAFMSIVPKNVTKIRGVGAGGKGLVWPMQNLYRMRTEPVHTRFAQCVTFIP